MENEFKYLTKRAELFIEFLDKNNIDSIFPERQATKKHLDSIIKTESLRKIKIFNDIIDNIIIGNNSLNIETKNKIIFYFNAELNENKNSLKEKKLKLYKYILNNKIIKSRNLINDAIEIANSEILGLSEIEKSELNEIISESMSNRIK